MIQCENVSFAYPPSRIGAGTEALEYSLKNVSCTIEAGDFVLLCGPSGCGKTTLTRLFNGLIPHYYEGTLTGRVLLDGKEYKDMSLFEISGHMGSVFQNPRSQFFNVDTTSELAFGPENHGLSREEILSRVEKVSKQLGLTDLLGKSIFSLSGGEKQKIACGSAAAMEPEIYVFDEPSSNLDTCAIEDFRMLLKILKDQGKTVIIAEHRLYYLHDLADRVLYLRDGEIKGNYTGAEFSLVPEMTREQMGLRPLTLDGFRKIQKLKKRPDMGNWLVRNLAFSYVRGQNTLQIQEEMIPRGRITAVTGRNGAGKTTFSRCLCGLERSSKGTLELDKTVYGRKQRLKQCYMVMQDVNHQLFTDSVLEEILLSMETEDVKTAEGILKEMDLWSVRDCHPMGLSGGQKQRAAIASAVASERPFLLFDEPTSGLDLFHMRQVAALADRLADMGKTILIVTHDPEFILLCCDQVIHMEKGHAVENYSLEDSQGRERLLAWFFGNART